MTEISATGIGSDNADGKAPPSDGNPSSGDGVTSNGSGSGTDTSINSGRESDNLNWLKTKGWVADDGSYKVADIAKGYQSLEKHLGSINKVPDEKAQPEEWDKFHKARGWPGEVKGYEFTKPDNLPPELPYDAKLADTFKEVFNQERLPAKTAQNLHDKFVQLQTQRFQDDVKAFTEKIAKDATTAHETFVKDWGEPPTETYKQNAEAARRALTGDPKLKGLEVKLKEAGLLTKEGHFTNFEIGHLLAAHGKQYMNDKFVAPNGQGRVDANPFARTTADGSPNPDFNMTEAGRLIKQNPSEAKRLISITGQNPAEYGLS